MNRKLLPFALLVLAVCSPSLRAQEPEAGIRVRIIGSGGPGNNPDRGESSVLIQYGSDSLLVDMGNGTQATLSLLGVKAVDLGALMITHHHVDHNQEFPPLLLEAVQGQTSPLVVGPSGTREMTDFTLSFYADDIAYRLSRRPGSRTAAIPQVREVHGGESFDALGFSVRTAAVNHTIETIAYRFELGGKSIVVSGDLFYSESLVDLAKDADLLILDGGAVVSIGAKRARPSRPSTPISEKDRSHGTADEILEMIKASGAKTVVLTHLGGGAVDEAAIGSFFSELRDLTIVIAADRMEFSL